MRVAWLLAALVISVWGHGRLTVPITRDQRASTPNYLQEAPVCINTCGPEFVCRSFPSGTPQLTLTAGQSVTTAWEFPALHVGDCFFYLSYDTDLPDSQQKYFKIAEIFDCKALSGSTYTLNIPSFVPPCDHCVLRFEWYALHVRPTIEFYSQCVDVTIVSDYTGGLPTPLVNIAVPGHLPGNGNDYRDAFAPASPQFMVGPALATPSGTTGTSSTSSSPTSSTTSSPPGSSTTGTATTSAAASCSELPVGGCSADCPCTLSGYCCSQYGFCGNTAEYCNGTATATTGNGATTGVTVPTTGDEVNGASLLLAPILLLAILMYFF
eukprot:TRINITY_DN126_c0_g1_i1.p1 TRINITY_DN126_c0_g1~~TRINITY_DN126_c0_g1_i1.p1  ORF type:complete len:324 (-),score=22.53 TRINITY_DN126_c0_g1_i1:83-1054(-)